MTKRERYRGRTELRGDRGREAKKGDRVKETARRVT
jgi:hypothetical protein